MKLETLAQILRPYEGFDEEQYQDLVQNPPGPLDRFKAFATNLSSNPILSMYTKHVEVRFSLFSDQRIGYPTVMGRTHYPKEIHENPLWAATAVTIAHKHDVDYDVDFRDTKCRCFWYSKSIWKPSDVTFAIKKVNRADKELSDKILKEIQRLRDL